MLRTTIKEKKITELIKKGGSTAHLNSVKKESSSTVKVVHARLPSTLLDEVDKLLNEKQKNRLGCRESRNSLILDALVKYINDTRKELTNAN